MSEIEKQRDAQQQLLVKRSNNRRLDARNKQLERELAAVTEQRDRLVEALEMVRDADEDCHKDGLTTIPPVARHRIDMALAAVKGGEL